MSKISPGKCKTAGGFIWMKKEDLNENNYSFEHKKLKINGL
jgi:hypothetical protein